MGKCNSARLRLGFVPYHNRSYPTHLGIVVVLAYLLEVLPAWYFDYIPYSKSI